MSEWINVELPPLPEYRSRGKRVAQPEPIYRLSPTRLQVMTPSLAASGDYDIDVSFVVRDALVVEVTLQASCRPAKSVIRSFAVSALGSWEPAMTQATIKLLPAGAHVLAGRALAALADNASEEDETLLRNLAEACLTPSNQRGFHQYPHRHLIEFAIRLVDAVKRPDDDPDFGTSRVAALGPAGRMHALGYPADRRTIRRWIDEAVHAGYVTPALDDLTAEGRKARDDLARADEASRNG